MGLRRSSISPTLTTLLLRWSTLVMGIGVVTTGTTGEITTTITDHASLGAKRPRAWGASGGLSADQASVRLAMRHEWSSQP